MTCFILGKANYALCIMNYELSAQVVEDFEGDGYWIAFGG